MKVRLVFNHSADAFEGKLLCGERFIFQVRQFRNGKFGKPVSRIKFSDCESASAELSDKLLGGVLTKPLPDVSTEAEFNAWFFDCVRDYILNQATRFGRLVYPENYPEHFWQKDFIAKLSKRLARKPNQRKILRLNVASLLIASWEKHRLNEMTRDEVWDYCKPFFQGQVARLYSPKSLWKITEELGLRSKRHPGPRSRCE